MTINPAEMPNHGHFPMALNAAGNSTTPAGAVWSQNVVGGRTGSTSLQFAPLAAESTLNGAALGDAGENQPHSNMQPYLAMQFLINAGGQIAPGGAASLTVCPAAYQHTGRDCGRPLPYKPLSRTSTPATLRRPFHKMLLRSPSICTTTGAMFAAPP